MIIMKEYGRCVGDIAYRWTTTLNGRCDDKVSIAFGAFYATATA